MNLFGKIIDLLQYFLIIFVLISLSIHKISPFDCQRDEILNNLSIILSTKYKFPMSTAIYVSDTRNEVNGICSTSTCCTNNTFDVLKEISKSLLHKMSGVHDVQEDLIKFNNKLKLLIIELVDSLVYKVYLSINSTNVIKSPSTVMLHFYQMFNYQIRLKLGSKDYSANFLNLKPCTFVELDTKTKSFIRKFEEITERFLLSFYRETTSLEAIIRKIEDISLSTNCVNELIKMSLCGICSQNLDWSLYAKKNITNNNVKICQNYCHNTIRKCMNYYILLMEPLKLLQETFVGFINKYTFDIDEYKKLWINNNEKSISIFLLILNLDEKFKINTKECNDSFDTTFQVAEDRIILDDQDLEAEKQFSDCLQMEICEIKADNMFVNYFTDQFSILRNQLNYILNYSINPQSFITNMMGYLCNNSSSSRCWNGLKTGSYDEKLVKFNSVKMRNVVHKNIQRELNVLINTINMARRNLINQYDSKKDQHSKNNEKPVIMQFEGSGVKSDDEDFDFKWRVFQTPKTTRIIFRHLNIKKFPKSEKFVLLNESSRPNILLFKNNFVSNNFSIYLLIILLFIVIYCLIFHL